MPIQAIAIQKRMRELGRVRLGQKNAAGHPEKLDTFRFTSASRALLEAVAALHGGDVAEWPGAPDEGYFQLTTEANELPIVFPPTFADEDGTPTIPVSQFFELWSGGGCQRRCDGVNEVFSGQECPCQAAVEAEGEKARACKPTTRMSFMLPDIPGLGVWRVESHGYNAAAELPGVVAVLARAAHEGKFIPAALRLEHRTKKVEGEKFPRRFVVPVVDLPDTTVKQLAAGEVPLSINGPTPPPPRPELPVTVAEPVAERFENDSAGAGFGTPPPLPDAKRDEAPPTPLSKDAFAALVRERDVDRELVKQLGGEMFPGKTAVKITNAQRGELWQALEARLPERSAS